MDFINAKEARKIANTTVDKNLEVVLQPIENLIVDCSMAGESSASFNKDYLDFRSDHFVNASIFLKKLGYNIKIIFHNKNGSKCVFELYDNYEMNMIDGELCRSIEDLKDAELIVSW